MELKSGEQAFMTTRPKLIQAGYTTARLNPPSQETEWNEILLPRSKTGGQMMMIAFITFKSSLVPLFEGL